MAFDFSKEPLRFHGLWPQFSLPLEVSIYSYCSLSCFYCYSNLNRRANDRDLNMANPTQRLMRQLAAALADETDPAGFFLRQKYGLIFSNATDPFQRQEKQYRSTETFLRWAQIDGIPLAVQTKGNVLHEEFERYAPYLVPGKDVVYISITHADDSTRRRTEPGALPIPRRWELARMLSDRGVPVVAACNPYVHEWVPDPEAYCKEAERAGCRSVVLEPLHLSKNQLQEIPPFYDPDTKKANLAPMFLVNKLKRWYACTEAHGLTFDPGMYWDCYFGEKATLPDYADPAWMGGNTLDFAFQVLRSVIDTSKLCGGRKVLFSWPDVRAFLEASGVPNPVLRTSAFWKPYYSGRMRGDLRCWRAKLGKEAPFYEIIRYFFNHPWENQNLVWYYPKVQALFDREKNLYVADDEHDLIAVYDPEAGIQGDQFTADVKDVDMNEAVWWDVAGLLGSADDADAARPEEPVTE